MTNQNCNYCQYLSKKPGMGNYFIYTCNYWGLTTKRILPQTVVASSIGKKCPFFKEKQRIVIKPKDKEIKKDGLDIII